MYILESGEVLKDFNTSRIQIALKLGILHLINYTSLTATWETFAAGFEIRICLTIGLFVYSCDKLLLGNVEVLGFY